jgi:two-component system, LytTR family, sensor kinase
MSFINNFIYSNRASYRLLRHSTFWTVDLINYMLTVVSQDREQFITYFYVIILSMPLVMAATYFIIYYLIPLSLKKPTRIVELVTWIILLLVVLGFGMRLYRFYFIAPLVDPTHTIITSVGDFSKIAGETLNSLLGICMATTIKFVKNKVELQQRNDQLLEEKKLTELNFLKAQMQPHFLFNTLNTLYSETIQDSGKAQQLVLHLSNLLRFILDECSKPLIPVKNEIRVIKDFIALEQMRHGSRLNVQMNIGEFDNTTFISPLIFLPFVENSFKHTLSSNSGTINIDIKIKKMGEQIFLSVENDVTDEPADADDHQKKGIANTKRQLDLLYGTAYSLDITETDNKYIISLLVPIKAAPQNG